MYVKKWAHKEMGSSIFENLSKLRQLLKEPGRIQPQVHMALKFFTALQDAL